MFCVIPEMAGNRHWPPGIGVDEISVASFTATIYKPCFFQLSYQVPNFWRH
jgi:hypothetical protein